jgi:predicted molibdopterin-dependent oxidoreductase YjgC
MVVPDVLFTKDVVKVSCPDDHDVTRGNLCIKGRFGFEHVQVRDEDPSRDGDI